MLNLFASITAIVEKEPPVGVDPKSVIERCARDGLQQSIESLRSTLTSCELGHVNEGLLVSIRVSPSCLSHRSLIHYPLARRARASVALAPHIWTASSLRSGNGENSTTCSQS